jgi:hypothetical protein
VGGVFIVSFQVSADFGSGLDACPDGRIEGFLPIRLDLEIIAQCRQEDELLDVT